MISRRSFLSAAPVAAIAAPSIARALPAPMPVVDAGRHGASPWRGDPLLNPKTTSRIWAHWGQRRNAVVGQIRASKVKAMMEEVLEEVTGHRPPFLLHTAGEDFYDFIFHPISNTINTTVVDGDRNIGGWILKQPCYVLEWTPERWATISQDSSSPFPYKQESKRMMEYMACMCFHDTNRVIYDL